MSERKLYQHIKTLLASGMVIPQSAEDAFDALDRFVNDVETEVVFDWDNISTVYQWVAVDMGGGAFAYRSKPVMTREGYWMNTEDNDNWEYLGDIALPIGFDWRESLQQRPKVA